MKSPAKLTAAAIAAIAAVMIAAALTGCAGMSPEAQAFWIRTGDKAVDVGIDIVKQKPVKVDPQK